MFSEWTYLELLSRIYPTSWTF